MYFERVAKGQPKPIVDVGQLSRIGVSPDRMYELDQNLRKELALYGGKVAAEIGAKNVNISPEDSHVGITFNVTPDERVVHYKGEKVATAVFDLTNLVRLNESLGGKDYTIRMGDYGRLPAAKMPVDETLMIEVVVNEKRTAVPKTTEFTGTREQLHDNGLLIKKGRRYLENTGVRLIDTGESIGGWGFLDLGSKKIYKAVQTTDEPKVTPEYSQIKVFAGGYVSVDAVHLGNEKMRKALDAVVRDLFQLPIEPKPPSS